MSEDSQAMQLHFDWTINIATILSAAYLVLLIPAYKLYRKLSDSIETVMAWLKEFPPHLHVAGSDGIIIYPKGMAPQVPLERRAEPLRDPHPREKE